MRHDLRRLIHLRLASSPLPHQVHARSAPQRHPCPNKAAPLPPVPVPLASVQQPEDLCLQPQLLPLQMRRLGQKRQLRRPQGWGQKGSSRGTIRRTAAGWQT